MPLHDVNYKHWQGAHRGLWQRRWAIARNGLTACLQIRWMTNFVVLCWGLGLTAAIFLFMVGQLLVADSVAARWASKLNPMLQTFVGSFTNWLANHPDISVGATQNFLFYEFGHYLMIVSIFLLGMAIPCLFTRDLACNAVVIYSSKAVSRGDYLLGRFASAFGFLTLTWLGPVCLAWFVGNLLAPDWSFFWHARGTLENILLFGLSSMLILSALALGVSASGTKEKGTTALWFTWWILGVVLVPIAVNTQKPWLCHLSFSFDINQIGLAIFRVSDNINTARESVPGLSNILQSHPGFGANFATPELAGTWFALVLMVAGAVWLIFKCVKPE